jgi:hypothetical protein
VALCPQCKEPFLINQSRYSVLADFETATTRIVLYPSLDADNVVCFWRSNRRCDARPVLHKRRVDFGPSGRLASTFACTPDSVRHDFGPLRQDLPASASSLLS